MIPSIVIKDIGSNKAPIPRIQPIKKVKSNKNITFFLKLDSEIFIHSKNNASDNKNMLQVIFFAILFGISMVILPSERIQYVQGFFDGINVLLNFLAGKSYRTIMKAPQKARFGTKRCSCG